MAETDHNFLVQMSLIGFVDNPAQELSRLLKSDQPLTTKTRLALADALDGRSKSAMLKLTVAGQSKVLQIFRSKLKHLRIGRDVQSRPAEQTFAAAAEEISRRYRKSPKTIENYHKLAKNCDDWIRRCRDRGVKHSDAELEIAFVYSEATGIKPEEAIKPSLDALTWLIVDFEKKVNAARGQASSKLRARPFVTLNPDSELG
jgi:hypothetical protein